MEQSIGAILTDQESQAYDILQKAAHRIAANNYTNQFRAHVKARRSSKTFQFVVTDAHERVVKTIGDLCQHKITAEEAVALIHYDYEVDRERLAGDGRD